MDKLLTVLKAFNDGQGNYRIFVFFAGIVLLFIGSQLLNPALPPDRFTFYTSWAKDILFLLAPAGAAVGVALTRQDGGK